MDDDESQACWHQLEIEQRQRYEIEQKMLKDDTKFEEWLEETH